MFYVYVLKSLKDKKLYIGKTKDLETRFRQHNNGKVEATKNRKPFELLYYEAFNNRIDQGREELFLKSGIGRESLRHRLENSLT